jgi:hypothetical protein
MGRFGSCRDYQKAKYPCELTVVPVLRVHDTCPSTMTLPLFTKVDPVPTVTCRALADPTKAMIAQALKVADLIRWWC